MFKSQRWIRPAAIFSGLFGLLTIFSGGVALFGGSAVKAVVGDAVPLVLWFNFLAGFVYILGAVALFNYAPSAKPIAWLIAISTALVFLVLIVTALSGTPFEWRTIGAMVFRSGFWMVIAMGLSKANKLA